MQKIVDYKLAVGKDYHELVERVYQLIEEGFEPHGSMVLSFELATYIQPMVKKEFIKIDHTLTQS